MNYLHCIRQLADNDLWLDVDATLPPSEEEKINFSLPLNRQLVDELRTKVAQAVQYYFRNTEFNYQVGLPVGALQIVYQELFGCLLDYEVLGFESLASFCLCLDGIGFHTCKIDDTYVLMPSLKTWHLPEVEPDFPRPRALPFFEYPKDVVEFGYALQEIDPRTYMIEGEAMKIVIMSFESPLKFHFLEFHLLWTFLQFRKGLTDFYRRNTELIMPREAIRPGQLCAVGYMTRRFFCVYDRGLIIDIFNETTVTVLLIDVGRKILAPMNIVKFLHKQFATFPVHSLPGTLAGLIPRTEEVSDCGNTKMILHLREPYLEAKIDSTNFDEPMFSLIVFSRHSRKSLNKHLQESGDYLFASYFPTGRFIRGADEVIYKPKFAMYEEPDNEFPQSEKEFLITLDSEGEVDINDPDSEEMEDPPAFFGRDPWTLLPETKPRIRPSPFIIRPRPVVDAVKSSLALSPVCAPPNKESDARQSDSNSPTSEDLKPIRLPLQAQALALKPKQNEGEIVETGLMSRPLAYDVLCKLKMMNSSRPSLSLFRRQFFLPVILQNEISVPREVLTPREVISVRIPEILSDDSSTDSDEFQNVSSTNEIQILKRAPWVDKDKKDTDTEQKPEEAEDGETEPSEESKVNVDRDKLFPPERWTYFDVPKARIHVSEDSTESDLEPENYTKEAVEMLTDEKLQEEMELNRLTVSLLATNQIVRDVARQRPERAYPMAKEWAKFALETNDSSLPDGSLFNPFDKLRENLDEILVLKYQLLAEMVPGFIYDEYAALAANTPLGNPSISINPKDDWQGFISPKNTLDDSENEEIEATPAVVENFRPTWETIQIEVTPSSKKRRYRLLVQNMDLLVSRDELKLLCVFPQLEIEERIKYCLRTAINWRIDTPSDKDEFESFIRFFNGYITLHKHVDRFQREAKKKRLFPRANR